MGNPWGTKAFLVLLSLELVQVITERPTRSAATPSRNTKTLRPNNPFDHFFGLNTPPSALFSSVGIHFTLITSSSFNSLKKLCRTLSCLDRPLTLQLCEISTDPSLSISNVMGFFTFNPIDSTMRITNNMS
jgi:hypothetical protein